VSYTPSVVGQSTVTASYGGDATHTGSSGSATVNAVLSLVSASDSLPTETRMANGDLVEERW